MHPQIINGHGQQRRRNPLPGAQQHVHLATITLDGYLTLFHYLLRRSALIGEYGIGQADEVIRGFAHGRNRHHHLMTTPHGTHHMVGYGPDTVRVRNRTPAELLHDEGHGAQNLLLGRT